MEKSLTVSLSAEAQREILDKLGIEVEAITLAASYEAMHEERARISGYVVAQLDAPREAGHAWVLSALSAAPQGSGGGLFDLDLDAVAGGGPQGAPSDKEF